MGSLEPQTDDTLYRPEQEGDPMANRGIRDAAGEERLQQPNDMIDTVQPHNELLGNMLEPENEGDGVATIQINTSGNLPKPSLLNTNQMTTSAANQQMRSSELGAQTMRSFNLAAIMAVDASGLRIREEGAQTATMVGGDESVAAGGTSLEDDQNYQFY